MRQTTENTTVAAAAAPQLAQLAARWAGPGRCQPGQLVALFKRICVRYLTRPRGLPLV